jgi:hypothetical protein
MKKRAVDPSDEEDINQRTSKSLEQEFTNVAEKYPDELNKERDSEHEDRVRQMPERQGPVDMSNRPLFATSIRRTTENRGEDLRRRPIREYQPHRLRSPQRYTLPDRQSPVYHRRSDFLDSH